MTPSSASKRSTRREFVKETAAAGAVSAGLLMAGTRTPPGAM